MKKLTAALLAMSMDRRTFSRLRSSGTGGDHGGGDRR